MAEHKNLYDSGKKLFSWTAHDYHPHDRGIAWYIGFSVIFFGIALWALIADPRWGWVTAFSLCIAAAVYLFIHRDGDRDHEVQVYEKGLLVDNKNFIHWDKFAQFWFAYDSTVAIINFDLKKTPEVPKKLQMGEITPDKFREILGMVDLPEAEGKEESVLDLWIRVLKL